MLPVKRRIKKQLLPVVFKKNRVFSSDFFTLRLHRQDKTSENSNFAVIVTNKIIPLSVERHLIKRRIHHLIQDIKDLPKTGFSFVIQIKKNPLLLNFPDLKKEIIKLFNQAKILT